MDMKKNQYFNPGEIWESIEVPDNLDLLIKNSVEEGYKRMQDKKKRTEKWRGKRMVAAVGIVVLGCAAAIPVKAFVTSLVQERMQHIPGEEIKEVESVMDSQEVNADSYSREYTQTEKERYGNLYRAYLQGTFPQGELRQEQTQKKEAADSLYYARDTSTFCLPERELTDEELLQIIEFETKRDYGAFRKNGAGGYHGRRKAGQGTDSGKRRDYEEKAIALGTEWLHNLYGVSEKGMELNHYLNTDMGAEGKGVYNVNFSVRSTEYYYFYFDPQDGTLLGASSSLAADMDADAVSYAVLEGKMEKMCETAKAVLTGKLQKEAEYEKIVCAYRDENGYLGSFNRIAYYFIRKDGSAYKIAMNAAREAFLDYAYIEDYGAYIQEQNPQTAEKSKNPNSGQGKTVYVEIGK